MSYADIAETVKIRKASIHHHFPTKAGLVAAVLRRHRANIAGGMKALDEEIDNPLSRIKNYFKYWEGCIDGKTLSFCIGALRGAEMPSLPEEVQTEVRLHFSMLTDWFERTLKAGSRARAIHLQGPLATEAQMLIAVLHGAMLSARNRLQRCVPFAGAGSSEQDFAAKIVGPTKDRPLRLLSFKDLPTRR